MSIHAVSTNTCKTIGPFGTMQSISNPRKVQLTHSNRRECTMPCHAHTNMDALPAFPRSPVWSN